MSEVVIRTRPLVPGIGSGSLLRLQAPISFWGGIDPETSEICDPRHPDFGTRLSGRVVWIPSTIGSSSSSSILLELIRGGIAPAALLLGQADPILSLGAIVAREMGHGVVPMLECAGAEPAQWPDNSRVVVETDGTVTVQG